MMHLKRRRRQALHVKWDKKKYIQLDLLQSCAVPTGSSYETTYGQRVDYGIKATQIVATVEVMMNIRNHALMTCFFGASSDSAK